MATPNLNLPQWELTDPILMEEFNNAFQTIDQFSAEIRQEIAVCNQIVLLWEGSLNPSSSITLSHTAFDFMQLMILTSDGITLTGAVAPSADNVTDFTAIATGAFAGAGATVYGFSATLSENGTALNSAFCYAQEIGTSANTPITATAIYGIGKRNTTIIDPVLTHNITTLFTGALSDMSYANLSESAYNFQFLAIKPSSGPNILMSVLSDAASVAGSVSIPIAEAYDTYMFSANIADNGNIFGDNRNVKITTTLGNPAQTIYSTFTVAAIYGICRISS